MTDSTYKSSPFRIEEIDELYNNVQKFRSTKFTGKLFEFIANFPKIAPYNAMLVFMQKPGSSYVATAKEWKEKYGRSPKSTANPLIILKTFGPIEFVFEANDTEGKPLPQEITNPFRTEGEISRKLKLSAKRLYEKLRDNKQSIFVVDWYKDEQPRSRVKSAIEEILDDDLPDSYDKEFFEMKTDLLMTHFMDMAVQGYGWVNT